MVLQVRNVPDQVAFRYSVASLEHQQHCAIGEVTLGWFVYMHRSPKRFVVYTYGLVAYLVNISAPGNYAAKHGIARCEKLSILGAFVAIFVETSSL